MAGIFPAVTDLISKPAGKTRVKRSVNQISLCLKIMGTAAISDQRKGEICLAGRGQLHRICGRLTNNPDGSTFHQQPTEQCMLVIESHRVTLASRDLPFRLGYRNNDFQLQAFGSEQTKLPSLRRVEPQTNPPFTF